MQLTEGKLDFNKKKIEEILNRENLYVTKLFSILPIPISAQKGIYWKVSSLKLFQLLI